MPVTQDIVATYRGPGRVARRLLATGPREDRALAFLMAACGLIFLSQWPVLARQAHLDQVALNPRLGASLLAWIFIAPLLLYALAGLCGLGLRVLGARSAGYGARLALFWSLLASTPLILLHGLVAGFVGPGPAQQIIGAIWLACFLWFWISAMKQVAG